MSSDIQVNSNVQNSRQEVKIGNVTVRIRPVLKSGREYYQVIDYSQGAGKRRLLNARNITEARTKAKGVAEAIIAGRKNVAGLKDDDLLAFVRAKEALGNYPQTVDNVVDEWVAAMTTLKGKATIAEAVKYFLTNGGPDTSPKKVKDVAAELMAFKEAQAMSGGYKGSLKARLKRINLLFAERELHTLTSSEIADFIHGLAMSAQTKVHYREAFWALFVFGQSKKYVPRGFNPVVDVAKPKVMQGEVGYFTTAEMRKLLSVCVGDLADCLPVLLFCGFAGLRPEEASRLRWEWVGQDAIKLPGHVGGSRVTKTGKGRIVPIAANLKAWLAAMRKKTGLVVSPCVKVKEVPGKLTRASGIQWRHDALRHGYGTYQHSIKRDIGALVESMGNSIAICRRHYICPMVTEAEGLDYFSILPDGHEKLVAMPAEATA